MKQRGFTVVEIMVVILVIAVLATIITFVYRDAQIEARDTARRATAQQVENAIGLLKFHTNTIETGGWTNDTSLGPDANGLCRYSSQGWIYYDSSSYPCTMGHQLMNVKLLPKDFFETIQPNKESESPVPRQQAMMIYRCDNNNRWLLYYHLEKPSPEDTNNLTRLRSGCPNNGVSEYNLLNVYKMRGAIEIRL